MNLDMVDIGGRCCHLWYQEAPQCLLIQALGEHEKENLAAEVEAMAAKGTVPFALAAVEIADWRRELMPWGNPEGCNEAMKTLRFLQVELLPQLESRWGKRPAILGGYSLAGLFALWAARETDLFTGVAAASPSVWLEGWPDYTAAHPMRARQVYLSLGEREEHTRNRVFAQVGERIRNENAQLRGQLGDGNCVLEWNAGGHFVDCEHRLARAFSWNLKRLARD